jgi:hypothetical protein
MPTGLHPPEMFTKNLKIILNVGMLCFNGSLCLFRIFVQRQIVLGYSVNKM